MSQIVPKILKWVSIPLLLIAAVFSSLEARYEPWIDLVICLGAIFLVERAVWAREYFWAAGFVAMVILFSPVALIVAAGFLAGCSAALINDLLDASEPAENQRSTNRFAEQMISTPIYWGFG